MKTPNVKVKFILGFVVIFAVFGASQFFFKEEDDLFSYFRLKPRNTAFSNVADANNQFALDFYSKVSNGTDNLFFSPFSISSAVSMTYEGAQGKTAEEIQKVFHLPEDPDLRRNEYAAMFKALNKKSNDYELNIANALWVEKDYKILNDYVELVNDYYAGNTTNLDFKYNSDEAVKIINSWVEKETNNKIVDLIPSGSVDDETKLILTNAIYFKGTWMDAFKDRNTKDKEFRLSKDKKIMTPMMRQTNSYNYMENNLLQILEIPYEGDLLSMLILLPKDDDMDRLESKLDFNTFNNWKNKLDYNEVVVHFPKFKFETKYFLADELKEMGMPTSFSNFIANFSGITAKGEDNLYISDVIHQANIEVDEKGTEAAAATGVIMPTIDSALGPSKPIPVFKADHPFIFVIQENSNGSILFMGKVNNPNL